jgi:hypothetical protein
VAVAPFLVRLATVDEPVKVLDALHVIVPGLQAVPVAVFHTLCVSSIPKYRHEIHRVASRITRFR